MNAQTAAKPASSPQTPSLPHAKPETIGLSPSRLQKLSDAFKREVDNACTDPTASLATVGAEVYLAGRSMFRP